MSRTRASPRGSGVEAIVCSNHGGRQLDGAASSISMLPKVVDAVGDQLEVLFDGGVRTGMDVERALALGARGCLIGRSYVWGLGAYGEAGVAKTIDIIKKELDVSMALTGVSSIAEIGPNVLLDPPFVQRPAARKAVKSAKSETAQLMARENSADARGISAFPRDHDALDGQRRLWPRQQRGLLLVLRTVVNRYLIDNGALDYVKGSVIGLVVETQCSYFKPISYPDRVTAALSVAHLGNSSVRYRVAVFRNDDDSAAAQGKFVHVYVERATNKPVPLPDAIRKALTPRTDVTIAMKDKAAPALTQQFLAWVAEAPRSYADAEPGGEAARIFRSGKTPSATGWSSSKAGRICRPRSSP